MLSQKKKKHLILRKPVVSVVVLESGLRFKTTSSLGLISNLRAILLGLESVSDSMAWVGFRI